jgi:hypothetical protein
MKTQSSPLRISCARFGSTRTAVVNPSPPGRIETEPTKQQQETLLKSTAQRRRDRARPERWGTAAGFIRSLGTQPSLRCRCKQTEERDASRDGLPALLISVTGRIDMALILHLPEEGSRGDLRTFPLSTVEIVISKFTQSRKSFGEDLYHDPRTGKSCRAFLSRKFESGKGL